MNDLGLYNIIIESRTWGFRGNALVVAYSYKSADRVLRTNGRFNATPDEYIILETVQIPTGVIYCQPHVISEVWDRRGIGPKGDKGDKGDIGYHPYTSLSRLRSYLYRVTFDTLPEDNDLSITPSGGCSSFVKDGKLYRNLDWGYSEVVSFHVVCNGFEGMAYSNSMNEGQLDDNIISQLPYNLTDGRNDSGIRISTHVIYNDWGWHGSGDIRLTKIPYLILSQVKSLEDFPNEVSSILDNVCSTAGLDSLGYLVQFLVTDGTTTYVLIPDISGANKYIAVDATDNPKLTNFRWYNSEEVSRSDEQMQERPTGIERWNMIPCKLSELAFTKAYESPTRLSEFIGERHTTKYSTDEELLEIYDIAHGLYEDRHRDNTTWQTLYSLVYSDKCLEELYTQEDFDTNYAIANNLINELSEVSKTGDYNDLINKPQSISMVVTYDDDTVQTYNVLVDEES